MIWQFLINSIEVDEPVGWSDVSWSAQRNLDTHGVWFSVKADSFKFVGDAFTALNDEYELNGAEGVATFQINYSCDNGATFDTFFVATFDFNTYRRTCGDMCYAECSVNPSSCVNKFLTRINTDVDMESTVDLDGNAITPAALDTITLISQNILLHNRTNNYDGLDIIHDGFIDTTGSKNAFIGVYFPGQTQEEWGIFNAYGNTPPILFKSTGSYFLSDITNFGDVQQLAIYQRTLDPLNCITSDATLDFRIKGTFNFTPQFTANNLQTSIVISRFTVADYSTGLPNVAMDTYSFGGTRNVATGATDSKAFDYIYSNTPYYITGDFILIYFYVTYDAVAATGGTDPYQVDINYDPETFFTMTYESACDDTTAEAIKLKNAFCNIWENYLGSDECGITCELPPCLEDIHLTNGLKIRQVTDPTPARIFLNWEDTFKNISKIFNIGYGFFDNEASFTVNSLDFWYAANTVLNLGSAREVRFSNATDFALGKINVGYSKYELEEINGLDEMNTTRTYRRNPSKISSELDLLCNFIAAGYTWELTRRKIQGKTGTQDYRYDNDIFILHTYQDESGTYPVQDNIASPSNIISPATRYNFYLTPIRNLMRWFKSIGSIVPDITNTELVFQSGKGNYVAEGQMTGECSCDGQVIAENETIDTTIYSDAECYTPLWRTVFAEFDIPLSVSDWQTIKGDPYGKFEFSCNNTNYAGYLVELDFNPNEGLGKFKMLLTLSGPSAAAILMEDSGYILQEDDSFILIE